MAHEEEVLGKAYDSRLMARLLKYLRPYRWQVAIALASIVLKSFADVLGPYLTKVAIDRYLAPKGAATGTSGVGSARTQSPASRKSQPSMSDCWSSASCSNFCKPTSCSGPARK
jgi:ABC-type multidrug transport system fused ATPase/permease subunit